MHTERPFGDLVSVTAGWNYGTDRYSPFFKATITAAIPPGDHGPPAVRPAAPFIENQPRSRDSRTRCPLLRSDTSGHARRVGAAAEVGSVRG